jgi:hypothetical protein
MHHRILTADHLAARGMQHNQFCPLCSTDPEDVQHLLINYPFSKEVIHLIWSWFNFVASVGPVSQNLGTASWLNSNEARANSLHRHEFTAILLYCWWNIWKERNMHIFDSVQLSKMQVALLAKEEIDMYKLAFKDVLL